VRLRGCRGGPRVFVLAAAALLAIPGCRKSTAVSVAVARRQDITIPVLCDGILEPEPGSERRAPEAASVDQLLVRDGSRVTAGEVLVRLSAPDLERQAREARSEADALEAEQASIASDLAALEAEAARRTRALESDERLLRSGAITSEIRDADAAAAADARSRLTSARARLAALAPGDPGSRLSLARRSAADLEARVARLTVTAPCAGIVYDLPRKAGERLDAGQIVAAVSDPARRRVRARVDEPDLPKIAPGQELTATFDGLPGREWRGAVDAVSSTLRDEAGRRVGDVTATLADPKALLPGNASVNVSIVTASRRDALVVPRAALGREGERRFVFVLDRSRARRRDVSVGLLGAAEAEITSGISAGDRVLLPGSTPLSDGASVSVAGSS
jgi:multidrug efflux pump subunit AcrA (membrane-fusion protein)